MKPQGVLAVWLAAFSGMFALELRAAEGRQAPDGKPPITAGPFVRMVRHNDGSRSVTARDETTKEMEISTYDPEGNLKLRRNYQLDRYGKPTSFLFYDGAGRPLVRGEYRYDALDRVVEEKWFELPSERPIRNLAQNYDALGKKRLAPESMHEATLPPEVVRWLEPDKAAETGKKAPEKNKGFLSSLKKKEKKETATPAGEPAPANPGGKAGLQNPFKQKK